MLTELTNIFELDKFQEVVDTWTTTPFYPKDKDEKVHLYQILAISAYEVKNDNLARDIANDALDLMKDAPSTEENMGLINMFGKIGIKSLLSDNKTLSAYKFIIHFNLGNYNSYFREEFATIKNIIANKIYGVIGISYFLLAISFFYLNRDNQLFASLDAIIIDFVLIIIAVIIFLRKNQISKFISKRL